MERENCGRRWRRFPGRKILLVLWMSAILLSCTRRVAKESASPDNLKPREVAASSVPRVLPEKFGFGRPATREEILAWDIDVMPDGTGLPPGSGTVDQGEEIYRVKCVACHGATGVEGPFDRLVGRNWGKNFDFGIDRHLTKTIGNYWQYATTLYDFIRRAMPQNDPGSLKPDEIYSLVAYLLYRNQIIPRDAVMDAQSLPKVVMPAYGHFVPDDRKGGPEVR